MNEQNRKQMVQSLNEDLAHEYSAIIQYLTYAAKVSGPYRRELSQFFTEEIADETRHAQFLANKIVAMGGEPTTTPKPVPDAKTPKEMLEAVRDAETDAQRRYTERAEEAEGMGLKGLQVDLEDMVSDETNHREETEKILRNWEI